MKAVELFLVVLAACESGGCGGEAWRDSDTTGAQNIVRVSADAIQLCDGDGGSCRPDFVRAEEVTSGCVAVSMLSHHKQSIPDAGTALGCQPQ